MMSNSSNIEQFIQQHRDAFDHASPDPACWAGIEKMLDRFPSADGLEQHLMLHRPMLDTAEPAASVWAAIEQELDPPAANPEHSLEGFIRQHRAAFDVATPDDKVWSAIEKAVPATETKIVRMPAYRQLVRIAAAIALLVIGMQLGLWYAAHNLSEPGMALSEVSQEYAELEQYYQRDISVKQQKLASFASYQDDNVRSDLLEMDEIMDQLREELANVPPANRERVVRAMIENYKAKAAILERVLRHLEQQQPNQHPATINSGNHEVESI
ncbi:MAG: hypothetical protein EP344_10680 [Bacteroidetes bacterium]|nr:MAG: hypothetical protein EP344_10680 [Bacteroidota bacterium]